MRCALPSWQNGVYASTELPSLWQLPSIDLAAVPLARGALPRVPAGPAIAAEVSRHNPPSPLPRAQCKQFHKECDSAESHSIAQHREADRLGLDP